MSDAHVLAREEPAAVRAFDAVAAAFDERYGEWASVAAQRRSVRRELLRTFPPGSMLLELGGGTGEDALFLAARDRRIVLTDGAPAMVEAARRKASAAGLAERIETERVLLEELAAFTSVRPAFDGAYSNFAALNCVADAEPVAEGLAHALTEGAHALLVVFGACCAGEVVVQLARGDAGAAFRRFSRGAVAARLGGREFTVRYPRPRDFARAFSPWFRLVRVRGIGVFVPPSAAEPGISRWPRVLELLEAMDRVATAPLARLGDHVLLDFRRTAAPAPLG